MLSNQDLTSPFSYYRLQQNLIYEKDGWKMSTP